VFIYEFETFYVSKECKSKNYEINSSKYVKFYLLISFVKNTNSVQEKVGRRYRVGNSEIETEYYTDYGGSRCFHSIVD
jgi:hypothetical protein